MSEPRRFIRNNIVNEKKEKAANTLHIDNLNL